MAYSIMVDAGHGGERDPGAVYNGRQEKDDALRLALAVGEILQNHGIDVEYTRTMGIRVARPEGYGGESGGGRSFLIDSQEFISDG